MNEEQKYTLDVAVIEAIRNGDMEKLGQWLGESPHVSTINKMVDRRECSYKVGESEVTSTGMTALHYAAFYGKMEIVQMLLDCGAIPTVRNVDEENVLQSAIQSGCKDCHIAEMAGLLLFKRTSFINDTAGDGGWTALLMAVSLKLPLTVQKLLDLGADPTIVRVGDVNEIGSAVAEAAAQDGNILRILLNSKLLQASNINLKTGGYTALHLAVLHNQIANVELLLSRGADLSARDVNKHSPVYYALEDRTVEDFIKLLSLLKKSINRKEGQQKHTLLHRAVIMNKRDFVVILRKQFNADFTIADSKGRIPLHYVSEHRNNEDLVDLLSDKEHLDVPDNKGYTPLHYAVKRSDCELTRVLLRAKTFTVDSSAKTADTGRNCIHLAAVGKGNDKDFKHMMNIFSHNVNDKQLQQMVNARDNAESTAVHLAMGKGLFSRVKTLLKLGADPALATSEETGKKQLIHLASVKDSSDIDFKEILSVIKRVSLKEGLFKKLVNAVDGAGRTPLHLAIEQRRFVRVVILLGFGADPGLTTLVDEQGGMRNSIHLLTVSNASEVEFNKVMLKIEEKSSDFEAYVNAQDKDGKTALQLALENSNLTRAEKLLELHPAISRQDQESCLQVAIKNNYPWRIVLKLLNMYDVVKTLTGGEVSADLSCTTDNQERVSKHPESLQAALKMAIQMRRFELTKMLLHVGAVADRKDFYNAVVHDESELALILVRYSSSVPMLKRILNEEIHSPYYGGAEAEGSPVPEDIPLDDKAETLLVMLPRRRHGNSEGEHVEVAVPGPKLDVAAPKTTTLFRELVCRMPDVAEEALERCVSVNLHKCKENVSVTFDYQFFHPRKVWLADPLEMMVKYARTKLLQHPVVGGFLYKKWNYLGFWFYFVNLSLYLLYLLLLSFFAVTVNHPLSVICVGNETAIATDEQCDARLDATYALATLVIILVIYHLIIEFLLFSSSIAIYIRTPKNYGKAPYLRNLQNYVKLLLYMLSLIFVFVYLNECGCPRDWQWQIGLVAMFLGWLHLIFLTYNFPGTGLYVIMFKTIFFTFFKLILFALLLIGAFSVILFMMFHDPTAKVSTFLNFGYSFLTTINMIARVASFDILFNINVPPSDYVPIPFYVLNFIIWVVFLIMFPIVFKNLLTSLAVGDVRKVRSQAELKKIALQVEIFLNAESILPDRIVDNLLEHIESPNLFPLRKKATRNVKMLIWGGRNFLDNIEEDAYEKKRKKDVKFLFGENEEEGGLKEIKKRLDELFDLIKSNEDGIKKCLENDHQLMQLAEVVD